MINFQARVQFTMKILNHFHASLIIGISMIWISTGLNTKVVFNIVQDSLLMIQSMEEGCCTYQTDRNSMDISKQTISKALVHSTQKMAHRSPVSGPKTEKQPDKLILINIIQYLYKIMVMHTSLCRLFTNFFDKLIEIEFQEQFLIPCELDVVSILLGNMPDLLFQFGVGFYGFVYDLDGFGDFLQGLGLVADF